MSSPQATYDQLPAELKSNLEQLCADLSASLGDDLLSVAVYGGVAKGESIALGQTPVPVLVVLQDASVAALSKISNVIQAAITSFQAAPFVVSLHDLQTSTDIFPIKFLDMQTHHCLLTGRDVLSELEISTQHLRLRCEQELCNLLLRLRNVFLRNAGNDDALQQAVRFGVAPFFTALGAAVNLKTGLTPITQQETADSAANVVSLDRDTLGRLLEFEAAGDDASNELSGLFNDFIGVVETAADFVDQLDNDSP
jgi:hypothetical protein